MGKCDTPALPRGAPEPKNGTIPWSGLIDRAGFQRRYRGPIELFDAKLDIAAALWKK